MPIPHLDDLREFYDAKDLEQIETLQRLLKPLPEAKQEAATFRFMVDYFDNEIDFMENCFWIQPKNSKPCPLRMNAAQKKFWNDVVLECRKEGRLIRGLCLKARQLGFSTLIQGLHFTWTIRNKYRQALVISYDSDSTNELHQKARFGHEMLWGKPGKLKRNKLQTMEWSHNGSVIHTRTAGNEHAGRGLTIHHLHCSEIPMWQDPVSVLTGLKQSIPTSAESTVFYESTARGAMGLFYDEWNDAEDGRSDYIPFFAPWQWDKGYTMDFHTGDERKIFARSRSEKDRKYQSQHGLTLEQMNWRGWKTDNDLGGNKALFRQEFPASAREAFLTSGSPVFDADAINELDRKSTEPVWIGHMMIG